MHVRALRMVVGVLAMGFALAVPVAGASASNATIETVIVSYNARILTAEGKILTATGEYDKSHNPSGVRSAIANSIATLKSLKSKLAAQSASTANGRKGKRKFEKGLQTVVVAYGHLSKAFGEKNVAPAAAKTDLKKALRGVKRGQTELREGARLLG